MQRQTTRLSDQQLAFLDKLTNELGYRCRSETIRWIICLARLIWTNLGAKFLLFMFKNSMTYILVNTSQKVDAELLTDHISKLEQEETEK